MKKCEQLIEWIGDAKLGAEVGVRGGSTTLRLLWSLPNLHLLLVDSWEGPYRQHMDTLLDRVKPYKHRTIVWPVKSTAAAAFTPPETLDFVWLDADHSTESVLLDCITWWEAIKPGGWLGGRLYWNGHRGLTTVKEGVDRFVSTLLRESLEVVHTSWRIEKHEEAQPSLDKGIGK